MKSNTKNKFHHQKKQLVVQRRRSSASSGSDASSAKARRRCSERPTRRANDWRHGGRKGMGVRERLVSLFEIGALHFWGWQNHSMPYGFVYFNRSSWDLHRGMRVLTHREIEVCMVVHGGFGCKLVCRCLFVKLFAVGCNWTCFFGGQKNVQQTPQCSVLAQGEVPRDWLFESDEGLYGGLPGFKTVL